MLWLFQLTGSSEKATIKVTRAVYVHFMNSGDVFGQQI